MPLIQGRKRRAEASEEASTPEPATQRRRTNNRDDDLDESFGGDAGIGAADSSLDQMVKKMVRLALACEYQRRPIRRSDISEKVLGTAGRQFKNVFNQAQLQLRTVFGVEMVELPAREKVTVQQRRAAQKTAEKSKTTTSWILLSILPPQFRDPQIMQPPAVPTAEEEGKYASIYTLLITLISLSGGSLPDTKMERYLRRVNMEDNTTVDSHPKTEQLLKRMEKEGYIVKVKESTGTGEDDIYWTVGPRGKVEVGEDGVRGLTRTVYGKLDEPEEEELERRIGRSLGVGEKVAPKRDAAATQNGERKKRGRKKKQNNEEQEEEEEDAEGDNSEEDVE